MKLFMTSRDMVDAEWKDVEYAIVCAEDEMAAKNIHPVDGKPLDVDRGNWDGWPKDQSQIEVRLLGVAAPEIPRGVICYSRF